MELQYRQMEERDIPACASLYVAYYNIYEGGAWTDRTAYRRIHQVWSCEDALCFLAEDHGTLVGFVMGYLEQYDDIEAYDLVEIVLAKPYQGRGLGSACMQELERRVRAAGGAMIQLQAVNDAMHEQFYGKLHYEDANNLRLKTKWI